jgi:thioredoxin reductase (NADPH)
MNKPVIMTVDDDPDVLSAIERDLRKHYRKDYRVIKAESGDIALENTRRLKQRDIPIALFLVDQRMPGMTGTDLLQEVSPLYPRSRKVLLTAYSDTQAAIDSINKVGLDYYLMKPWDPPDERLYPVLDDLLSDWTANFKMPFDGIRVAGAKWSRQCYQIKEFLSRNRVPYQWIDIELDESTQKLVSDITEGDLTKLPVMFLTDGSHLVAPTNLELASQIGLDTTAKQPFYDLIVIGGGPAGLANAVYGSSEGLSTLLIEQNAPGGQAGTSSRIENYLGFPTGISGANLARRATTQARRFGTEMLTAQEVTRISCEDPYRIVRMADGSEVSCYAVMVATGMSVRKLEVPGLDVLVGAGVYYGAATTEAATYRDGEVCVVGGANSAGQGALYFSRYAEHVTMLVRADGLEDSMSQYLIDRINSTRNIDVINKVVVSGVFGNGHLEKIELQDIETLETKTVDSNALFIFVGSAPRSEILKSIVEMDEKDFILTGPDIPRVKNRPRGWILDRDPFMFETSMPGIFAAGDVRSGANRRVAAAVGEGSAAIYDIHKYLETV